MKASTGAIMLVSAVVAVTGLVYFTGTPTPPPPGGASGELTPRNPPSPNRGAGDVPPAVSSSPADHDDDDGGDRQSPTGAELQDKYAEVSDNPDYPQLQTRLEAMRERRPSRSFDAEQVVDTLSQREAWSRVEEPPEELPLTRVEKFDGREFIRFNRDRVEALMPGDTLEIPIWQLGERYTMRVDRAEIHNNGSVTWHGHLENFSETHRVTITVGDGLSVGGMDTPRGHYVLQAHGESGWIASSETLFKRNETETDMIIPPEGETGQDH